MKTKLIILVAVLTLAFTGCGSSTKVKSVNDIQPIEQEQESMFVKVEEIPYAWDVVYHKDTKVMYVISRGSYNYGTFTLLVNPDGTPMIYEEDK